MSGPVKEFVFPYTTTGRTRNMPWRWYWKNARFFRFTVYSIAICIPVFWKIDNLMHSPGNVEFWKQKRASREHTHFDAPHE